MDLTILEALEITTQETKEYIDEQPVISYGETQFLNAASRMTAKNNVGVFVGSDEPANALDGDIWIDTDKNVEPSGPVTPGPSANIELDDTLTVAGMAADAKAVGDALAEIPVEVSDDGYTSIEGLRNATSIDMVRTGNTIVITTVYDGDIAAESVITLDENDYPISITTDGVECTISWEGF